MKSKLTIKNLSHELDINGTRAVALISYEQGKVTRVICGNEQLTDQDIIDQAQELVDNQMEE